ncbi:MAG: hypothetical protein KDL10_11775, partial [Kiritimatiellae bacterium]|nr:hypothetical protein [Kiritimatiellia bacterium]
VAPWAPLLAWIAFWLFAVSWRELYPVLMRGWFVGVILIGLMATLVWATVAPPADGFHRLFGLAVTNGVGKIVYVTSLMIIAMLCGSVQLSGCCSTCCNFEEPEVEEISHGH